MHSASSGGRKKLAFVRKENGSEDLAKPRISNRQLSADSGTSLRPHLTHAPPRYGDFSESATSADSDYRRDRSTADTDRSEISPYLGSPRTTSGWPKIPPHPSASEVGRFLRKRQRKGTWNTVEIGPPRTRTARRSVPTSEVLGLDLVGRKTHLTQTPPRWGDFSESARSAGMERRRASPAQTRTARRSVPTSEVLGLHLVGRKINLA